MKVIRGQRVTVPEFEIVSNPTVRIGDVKQKRFNLIDRIGKMEDQKFTLDSNQSKYNVITKPHLGWYVSEIIGMSIVNPRGITTGFEIVDKNVPFAKEELHPENKFFYDT